MSSMMKEKPNQNFMDSTTWPTTIPVSSNKFRMQSLEVDGGISVPLVNRETWQALPPSHTVPLPHPITHVRFTYEDLRKYNEDMFRMMPDCQKHYMEKEGLPDIPYNFLVGPGGIIVEGRGWHTHPCRPNRYPELKGKSCLDIAYIGDFSSDDPTWEMLRSGMYLIMQGLKEKFISPSFETIPLRDVAKKFQGYLTPEERKELGFDKSEDSKVVEE